MYPPPYRDPYIARLERRMLHVTVGGVAVAMVATVLLVVSLFDPADWRALLAASNWLVRADAAAALVALGVLAFKARRRREALARDASQPRDGELP